MRNYSHNPQLIVVYSFLRYFLFFVPFLTPFFLANGLTYSQIFFLHFVFGVTILFLEVPFGYITDRVGRKVALILSCLFMSSAFVAYGFGTTYADFIIADIILAVGYCFYSGTYSALMYDSLLHLKREKEYSKWMGYILGSQRTAEVIAAFIATFIVVYSMQYTFFFTIIPFVVALPVIFFIKEPKIKKEPLGIGHWHHLGKVVSDAYNDPIVFWLSIYASITSGTMLAAIWVFQTLFTTFGVETVALSYLWIALLITSGTGSLSAYWIEQKLGLHFSFVGLLLFLFLGLILTGLIPAPYSLFSMMLCTFLWGFSIPVTYAALNRYLRSSRRATVLSFKSMLQRCFQMTFTLLLSFVLVSLSLEVSLLVLGTVVGVVGGYALLRLHAEGLFA